MGCYSIFNFLINIKGNHDMRIYNHKKNKAEKKGHQYPLMNNKKKVSSCRRQHDLTFCSASGRTKRRSTITKYLHSLSCCYHNNNSEIDVQKTSDVKPWSWPPEGDDRFGLESDTSDIDYKPVRHPPIGSNIFYSWQNKFGYSKFDTQGSENKISDMKIPLINKSTNVWDGLYPEIDDPSDQNHILNNLTSNSDTHFQKYNPDDFYTPNNSGMTINILDSEKNKDSIISDFNELNLMPSNINTLSQSTTSYESDSDTSTESLVKYFTTVLEKIKTEDNVNSLPYFH